MAQYYSVSAEPDWKELRFHAACTPAHRNKNVKHSVGVQLVASRKSQEKTQEIYLGLAVLTSLLFRENPAHCSFDESKLICHTQNLPKFAKNERRYPERWIRSMMFSKSSPNRYTVTATCRPSMELRLTD
ncbi:MAG: hypothetical protein GY820_00590 [Gammaproteobacteria bacterium]|nr:hypothetical protein [Gammaproteobacteria bacterium]